MSDGIFSVSQLCHDFSSVADWIETNGKAIIGDNDTPKYLMVELSADEKIDIVCKQVLNKYRDAFLRLSE